METAEAAVGREGWEGKAVAAVVGSGGQAAEKAGAGRADPAEREVAAVRAAARTVATAGGGLVAGMRGADATASVT